MYVYIYMFLCIYIYIYDMYIYIYICHIQVPCVSPVSTPSLRSGKKQKQNKQHPSSARQEAASVGSAGPSLPSESTCMALRVRTGASPRVKTNMFLFLLNQKRRRTKNGPEGNLQKPTHIPLMPVLFGFEVWNAPRFLGESPGS